MRKYYFLNHSLITSSTSISVPQFQHSPFLIIDCKDIVCVISSPQQGGYNKYPSTLPYPSKLFVYTLSIRVVNCLRHEPNRDPYFLLELSFQVGV